MGNLYLMQYGQSGQWDYRLQSNLPSSLYMATFHIVGTDGTKCGPELWMYGQPELLEAKRLFGNPGTDSPGTEPTIEWVLSSGAETCAQTCASHPSIAHECSEDYWGQAATESTVRDLFSKLGK